MELGSLSFYCNVIAYSVVLIKDGYNIKHLY